MLPSASLAIPHLNLLLAARVLVNKVIQRSEDVCCCPRRLLRWTIRVSQLSQRIKLCGYPCPPELSDPVGRLVSAGEHSVGSHACCNTELAERQPSSGVTGVRSLPAGGALEVWPCDFGPKQFGWLINQLGEPKFYEKLTTVLVF